MPVSAASSHRRSRPPPWAPATLGGQTPADGPGLYRLIRPIVAACSTQDILVAGCHALGVALDTAAAAVSIDDASTEATRFAAGSETAARAITHQRANGQGPHLAAQGTGEMIVVDNLLADARWPATTGALRRLGVRSVLALPVTFNGHRAGAASLYHTQARTLDADQLRDARLLAEAIAAALTYRQRQDTPPTRNDRV